MAEARVPIMPSPGASVDARAVMMRMAVQVVVVLMVEMVEVSGEGLGRAAGMARVRGRSGRIGRRVRRKMGEYIVCGGMNGLD